MPQWFQSRSVIWVYLRSATLWTLWIAHNDTVFNQTQWNHAKLEGTIWANLTDYAIWQDIPHARTEPGNVNKNLPLFLCLLIKN
jgi:hypothetical protein